ncbi:hypothetical protein B0T17DRAFT_331824 [Bombardia bombarda]|uniref:protein-histidine N-methyltransferase n=1 Tax=Bombardia bombarda TaxID=252184 RepID=A0AA39WMR6_9PEZI|nr:hypothetical protein B0T17DRAFT_331824 [Bombardia bombarda]
MESNFSFSFAGDDIEEDAGQQQSVLPLKKSPAQAAPSVSTTPASANAFPVQGKPLLPPAHHDLDHMLSRLPSKIAFGTLSVDLDGAGRTIQIPRRELWDVRVQLMAEEGQEEGESQQQQPGLGEHDVKTGIYEGGFKSWESSVDLVKVMAAEKIPHVLNRNPSVLIELGCGTALPSLALFQWALAERRAATSGRDKVPLVLTLADYNPSVLYLVTLPNFILAWALEQRGRGENPVLEEAFSSDEELDLTPEVLAAFKASLASSQITLSFLSGAWSPEFVELLYQSSFSAGLAEAAGDVNTLVIGAETIYSPFALESFAQTLLSILERERRERPSGYAAAIIGAKRLYFGVGGSLDDFVDRMEGFGASVETLHEEAEGVRRGVVRCLLS